MNMKTGKGRPPEDVKWPLAVYFGKDGLGHWALAYDAKEALCQSDEDYGRPIGYIWGCFKRDDNSSPIESTDTWIELGGAGMDRRCMKESDWNQHFSTLNKEDEAETRGQEKDFHRKM